MSKVPNNVVYIESVARPSAQGRHKYQSVTGMIVGKTKSISSAGRDMGTTYPFAFNERTSRLNTGFDELVENPYKADSWEKSGLPLMWKDSNVWLKEKIKEQHIWEIRDNEPMGTYDSIPPDMFNRKGAKQTFVQGFRLHLTDGTNILDLNTREGRFGYRLALRSSKIANSKEDVNTAFHSHFISRVNEAEEKKAVDNRKVAKAYAALETIMSKSSKTNVHKLASVLGLVVGETSPEKDENSLFEYIASEQGSKRLSNVDKLIHYANMMTSKEDKKRFDAEYMLTELNNYRVIYNNREIYKWPNSKYPSLETLGKNREQVLNWLIDPENEEYKLELLGELVAKGGPKLS